MIHRVVDVDTSLHMRTTTTNDGKHKIYSSVDQRMDACEDNGELCGRLRKDIIEASTHAAASASIQQKKLGSSFATLSGGGMKPLPLRFVQF